MSVWKKSPLRYPGGKSRAIAQILQHLPIQMDEFREPFVGGGSVFLAVKSLFGKRIKRYWINDLNPDVSAFWLTARDKLDLLVAEVWRYKHEFSHGRALYQFFKRDDVVWTPFEKAVRFFIMNRITFSGVMDAGGYSQQSFESRFTGSSIQRLQEIGYYLQDVEISQDDYAPLIETEGTQVFIFLDPPYLSVTESRLYGERGHLHTGFDHIRFVETVRTCPHRWLITYDDSPQVRSLFDFGTISTWELQYGMNNYKQKQAAKGQELFIKNY